MKRLTLRQNFCLLPLCVAAIALLPASASAAKKAPLPDAHGLTLLDSGKAPKRKLLLKLKPGTKGTARTKSQSMSSGPMEPSWP